MSVGVLFCTTNGVGLGHVTRCMAIGRRLPNDLTPLVFTLSQAVPVVRGQGFAAEYLHSAGTAGTDRVDWQLLLEGRLAELCKLYDPAVVVFDGTSPYPGFCARVRADRARTWVWNRRAMWKPGLGAASLALSGLFDAVLEPGEWAAPADRGGTVDAGDAIRVDPVLLVDPAEQLDRRAARQALGLDADAVVVLLQLGAGAINDVDSLRGAAASVLRARGDVTVVVAESTIAATTGTLPDDVRVLRTYPLQPLLAAFDVVVTAAGYNSFHEVVAAGVPAVLVPNRETQLDDQAARAGFAAQAGVARIWDGRDRQGFAEAVGPLLDDPEARERARRAAALRPVRNGAGAAADVLARLARGEGGSARRRR